MFCVPSLRTGVPGEDLQKVLGMAGTQVHEGLVADGTLWDSYSLRVWSSDPATKMGYAGDDGRLVVMRREPGSQLVEGTFLEDAIWKLHGRIGRTGPGFFGEVVAPLMSYVSGNAAVAAYLNGAESTSYGRAALGIVRKRVPTLELDSLPATVQFSQDAEYALMERGRLGIMPVVRQAI